MLLNFKKRLRDYMQRNDTAINSKVKALTKTLLPHLSLSVLHKTFYITKLLKHRYQLLQISINFKIEITDVKCRYTKYLLVIKRFSELFQGS